MAIVRERVCTNCNKDYVTAQYTSKYCSTDCKNATRSNKTATNRITRINTSDEWLWLARECKRAGTIEILRDVDLVELFSVYRRRIRCFGWSSEKKTSKYNLCHISPSAGKDTIGQLHHLNLFIGNSLANKVHGNKEIKGAGLSIQRSTLKKKWLVKPDTPDKQILVKVVAYLGNKLTTYAKHNPINKSQRLVLASKIKTEYPNHPTSLEDLEKSSTTILRKLLAELQDKTPYTMNLKPRRTLVVLIEELERFAVQGDSSRAAELLYMADACRCVALLVMDQRNEDGFSLVGGEAYGCHFQPLKLKPNQDLSRLRNFISFQAFNTLQGESVDKLFISNTLRKYLQVVTLDHYDSRKDHSPDWLSKADWAVEAIDLFIVQTEKNKAALHNLGLVDSEVLFI